MSVKIKVDISTQSYDVIIGALQEIAFAKKYSKILVISNVVVGRLYLDAICSKIRHHDIVSYCLDDGEEYKNFESVQKIIAFALQEKLDRKSLMIALGGGVISDITGFVSGIYQRGIDFINIPTTLLAQIDASVGGKTGINTDFGKNLVGLFHQPQTVLVYPEFLKTLSRREFVSGIAEMIKIAVCFDRDFFEFLEQKDLYQEKNLVEAIAKAIEIKARVVALDEKEEGIRAGLNYGHTFGHVIELETRYQQFLHGEAVAIGMQMANILALLIGKISQEELLRIEKVLKKYSLDFKYQIKNIESFYQKFFLDKKTQHKVLHFILPSSIGKMIIYKEATKEQLLKVLGGFV